MDTQAEEKVIEKKRKLPEDLAKNTDGERPKKVKRPNQRPQGKKKRIAKRKVALLMGYVGTGYYGMQWQG